MIFVNYLLWFEEILREFIVVINERKLFATNFGNIYFQGFQKLIRDLSLIITLNNFWQFYLQTNLRINESVFLKSLKCEFTKVDAVFLSWQHNSILQRLKNFNFQILGKKLIKLEYFLSRYFRKT